MRNSSWAIALLLVSGALTALLVPASAQNGCTWNGDSVYVDVNNDQRVSAGDVRITSARGYGPGTRVGNEADQGAGLQLLPGIFRYFDVNSDGSPGSADRPFWDTNNNGFGVGDIYLADVEANWGPPYGTITLPFGLVRGPYDTGIPGYTTAAWPVNPQFAYFDENNNNAVNLDEPVYAVQTLTTVQSGDVRITPISIFRAGSIVESVDGDRGLAVKGPLQIMYADQDNSGSFNYPTDRQAWTDCPSGQSNPYQRAPSQTQPPLTTTQPQSTQQQTSNAQTGGSGGDGGGISWTTVAIVAVVVLGAAYVLGNMSKKKQ